MARIFEGSGGTGDHQDDNILRISADGQDRIAVPGNEFIADSDMSRDGQDLVLSSPDGSTVIVEGYFSAEPSPMIAGPHGASLSPDLVNSFLSASPQYAQASTMTDESPVGAVEEIKGNATVTHADGSSENLTIGSPIYEGDVVQTDGSGAVNIVFVDETSMAVSENARLAIDEYAFDPVTESGTTDFSVLRGVFVFTSGLIGRDDPDDVSIDTPVGSIGIRGTIIAGNINPQGESEITVVEGAIVVKNGVSERTLSVQFETVKLTGFENDMQDMGVLDGNAIGNAFGSVSDVAPSLFSAINDAAGEQGQNDGNNAQQDAAEEGSDADASGDDATDTENDSDGSESQDMQMNDGSDTFTDKTFKEAATETKTQTQQQTETDTTVTGTHTLTTQNTTLKSLSTADNPAVRTTRTTTTTNTDTQTDPATPTHTVLDLNNANATNGVARISDDYAGGNHIGYSVSVADFNNDGYADIVFSNNTSNASQSHMYQVLGAAGGITSGLLSGAGVNIIALPDPNGGSTADISETHITAIGDFDGNGTMDFLVGQQNADSISAVGSGAAFIFDGSNATNWTSFEGFTSNDYLGASISALGDINNDGFADVIVGAPDAGPGGQAYVVYGGDNGLVPTQITLPGLSASEGAIQNGATSASLGASVVGIGDFDGDGFNDYAIGASGANAGQGKVIIYSGADNSQITSVTGYTNSIVLSLLGFSQDHKLGTDIMSLGDINGDGKSDILFGSDGVDSEAYILLGGASAGVTLNNTDTGSYGLGTSGYKINTGGANILGGGSAGDFNGDGFDDFVLAVEDGSGANLYVVYGNDQSNGIGSGDHQFSLADLDNPDFAFKMHYDGSNVAGDLEFTFGAGDIDGDGLDDLVIGIANADNGQGEVLVVDGRESDNVTYVRDGDTNDATGTTPDGIVAASTAGQTLVANGNDSLADDGHADINFRGSNANNTIYLSNTDFTNINGGLGTDMLKMETNAGDLDFSGVYSERISHVEIINMSSGDDNLTLSIANIFDMLRTSDDGTLTIAYNSGTGNLYLNSDNAVSGASTIDQIVNALTALTDATVTHNTSASAGSVEAFDIGGYTLYIDDSVMTNTAVV